LRDKLVIAGVSRHGFPGLRSRISLALARASSARSRQYLQSYPLLEVMLRPQCVASTGILIARSCTLVMLNQQSARFG